MVVGLIIPWFLNAFFFLLGILSFSGLLFILHRLILGPILSAQADIESPPMEEGTVEDIVLEHERIRQITIGQLDSDIKTRMHGIREDHLTLLLRKDPDLEVYTITATPGGPILFRRPHSKKYELMSGVDSFESSELIGYPALFRLAANMRDGRLIHYMEFELSTKYFINNSGEEKMRFMLKFVKFYPGLDRESRNKRGIFMFGRLQVSGDEQSEEESE